MAIDTAAKRRIILELECPAPDGVISASDRGEILGQYYILSLIVSRNVESYIVTAENREFAILTENRTLSI